MDDFVVSPVNARKQLLALIHRAHKRLLIYDPNIADAEMLRALDTRARHGVSVRIIGSVGRKSPRLNVRPLGGFRLHTRAIIRDGCEGFVGSQSLRRPSSIRGAKSASSSATRRSSPVSSIRSKLTGRRKETIESAATLQAARHALKRNLKANMKKLSPLDPLVREALREVVSKTDGSATLTTREMKDTVEKAVREAVRERVQEMLSESGER